MISTVIQWNRQGGRRYPQSSSPFNGALAYNVGGIVTIPVVPVVPVTSAADQWWGAWEPMKLDLMQEPKAPKKPALVIGYVETWQGAQLTFGSGTVHPRVRASVRTGQRVQKTEVRGEIALSERDERELLELMNLIEVMRIDN